MTSLTLLSSGLRVWDRSLCGEIKCGHQGNVMNTGDDKGHFGKC